MHRPTALTAAPRGGVGLLGGTLHPPPPGSAAAPITALCLSFPCSHTPSVKRLPFPTSLVRILCKALCQGFIIIFFPLRKLNISFLFLLLVAKCSDSTGRGPRLQSTASGAGRRMLLGGCLLLGFSFPVQILGRRRRSHPRHTVAWPWWSSCQQREPEGSCTHCIAELPMGHLPTAALGHSPGLGQDSLVAAATSCHLPMPPSLQHRELSEHRVMTLWCPQCAPRIASAYGGAHIRTFCILQTHSCRSCAQHHPHLSLCNSTTAAVLHPAMPIRGCGISVSTPRAHCVQEAAGQCES